VALVQLGKMKCAAKAGRLASGIAVLFILRTEIQTALTKIALSDGFCLSVDGCTFVG
jgi:hypothetical protein